MIGRVLFTDSGHEHTATLADDGVWSCTTLPFVAKLLNALARGRDYSAASGYMLMAELDDAADLLNGEVHRVPKIKPPANAVF